MRRRRRWGCTGAATTSCFIPVSRGGTCARVRANLTLVFSLYFPGIDYTSRETDNDMLMVEHQSGEREVDDDEYERRRWPVDQLRPATGGRVFVARTAGTGYVHCGWS